jgi:sec-independent protein translocase protein TatA
MSEGSGRYLPGRSLEHRPVGQYAFIAARRPPMPQLGPLEFIIILVIFMIFFGAGKLGDLGGAVGRGIKEFKKNAGFDESEKSEKPDEQTPTKPA